MSQLDGSALRLKETMQGAAVFDVILILTAGFLAGGLNAIAGGGSFLTFPALVFVGVPPISANATSGVAVFPGYLSSTLGFIDELKAFPRPALLFFIALSILGGVLGAVLLLITPSEVFSFVVPWLLLFATVLFAFDKPLRRLIRAEDGISTGKRLAATLAVTTYGGYFNGGLGIVLLALFSALGYRDMNQMNGLKNLLSFILSAAAVLTFAIAGIVVWKLALIMMVANTIGGYGGARIARNLPVKAVRSIVICVGSIMTLAFFLQGV